MSSGSAARSSRRQQAEHALTGSADRLCERVSGWTDARWAVSGRGGVRSMIVREVIQHVADLSARAENQPVRAVPWLGPGDVLRDQLRVVTADLIKARPSVELLERATQLICAASAAMRRVDASRGADRSRGAEDQPTN